MWNGEQWVSDFKQRNMIPAKAYYKTNWKIFRTCPKKSQEGDPKVKGALSYFLLYHLRPEAG